MASNKPSRTNFLRWALVPVILIAGGVAAMAAWRSNGDGASSSALPKYEVRREALTISVTESGAVQARDQKIIKSEVEGQTTIIYLVDEGVQVSEGELLVQLDASNLEDNKVEQQIRVQNAEAAYIRAREQLEVTRSQNTSDIARATLDFQFAKEDLVRYTQGEYPNQLKEAQTKVTLAGEDLIRTSDRLEWSTTLRNDKYISETEFRADDLAKKRAELEKQLADSALTLLIDYTNKRQVIELTAEIEQMEMALDRVKRKASADLVQAEADLKAKEAEYKQQQQKLVKFEDQITKTKIYAPVSGMVVYASSANGSWRGNAEPLDEGQNVRERQELIYLPTADSMMAEIKVHESSLDKIAKDMPVQVRVDALPGKVFPGIVAKIAPLPDAQSMWLNPDLKVFSTVIHLENTTGELRTGMSCQATIIVNRLQDVVSVPVQSIVRRAGRTVAYVVKDGGPAEERNVEIGLDNNSKVHIRSGLEPGEWILLAPPLASTSDAAAQAPDEAALATPAVSPASKPDGTPTPAPASGAPTKRPNQTPPAAPTPATDDAAAAPDAAAEAAPAAASDDPREQMRRRMENMTPDQREEMRKRFENMSDEDRQRLRQQYGGGGNGGGGRQGGAG